MTETNPMRDPEDLSAKLRAKALSTTAAELGLDALAPGIPFGVLMELGLPPGALTLVCFATGDVSTYFSRVGGLIGGTGENGIREAGLRMLETATGLVDELGMLSVTAPGLPPEGSTQFIALLADGLRSVRLSTQLAASGDSLLTPLFAAGQDVLTHIRDLQDSDSPLVP